MTPARADRLLALLLRGVGGLLLLALPAVPLPHAWMDAGHRHVLALGPLPDAVIVGYLARTASLLYAVHGAVMLFASFDVPRYRPLIVLVGVLNGAFGAAAGAVDVCVGMPGWWTLWEGPGIVLVAVATVWLACRGAVVPDVRAAGPGPPPPAAG
jgi:hypothetical protein